MRSNLVWTALLSVGSLLVLSGCTGKPAAEHGGEEHHHHVHGPHEGELIEIGNEEYHAELLMEDNNKVTIYVLVGLLAGIAGIMHVTLSRNANPYELAGTELDIIAMRPMCTSLSALRRSASKSPARSAASGPCQFLAETRCPCPWCGNK